MNITVIGTGFVGVVTAAVYASFGHDVIGLDIDQEKVAQLKENKVPFFEPGLQELLEEQQAAGRLTFTTDYPSAVSDAAVVVIAVNTPSKDSGEVELRYLFSACESMAPHLRDQAVVVVKSTVPPGTLDDVTERIAAKTAVTFYPAAVPEFLKEGSAVQDTLQPDRIVIGATAQHARELLVKLHEPLQAPTVLVSPESAQMAKYAANAYLATRITFINQVADLCETTSADVTEVIEAIGHDQRIGHHYWYPGFGYGGSCFPKDVKELAAYSRQAGYGQNLFNKLDELNEERPERLLMHYGQLIGGWEEKRVAVLGLSFKPNTNDMRQAPSLRVIPHLLEAGASVVGYDPQALSEAKQVLGELVAQQQARQAATLSFADSLSAAVAKADVVIALIEWDEIVQFDYSSAVPAAAAKRFFIDARNQFDPATVRGWGYQYFGVGRQAPRREIEERTT